MMIRDLLARGRENRLTTAELCALTGLSRRELQSRIREERLSGTLILSTRGGDGGYFLPSNRAEIINFLRESEGEAKKIFAMLRTAREALKAPEGQLEIGADYVEE